MAVYLLSLVSLMACNDHPKPMPIVKGTGPSMFQKRVAVFAFLADVNYNLVTSSEADLVKNTLKIDDALQNNAAIRNYVGTDWRVVWGPAIANSPRKSGTSVVDSFVTDNTMYAVRGTNLATGKPMYVVGVAGTNIVSRKGWRQEDFNVFTLKDWGMPNSGRISAGSNVGLTILNTMKDAATGQTLLEFFGTQPDISTADIAFTGHSLGGALSPLIALKCIEWKEQHGFTNLTVGAYPIAGPSPGDSQFAAYAAQKFGNNYYSVINNYDIVPNSWQKDMFARIPTLYAASPPFNPGGQGGFALPAKDRLLYDAIKVAIDLKQYQRIAVDKEYAFNGSPNSYTPDKPGSFFTEAGFQHTSAYFIDAYAFPQPLDDALALLLRN